MRAINKILKEIAKIQVVLDDDSNTLNWEGWYEK